MSSTKSPEIARTPRKFGATIVAFLIGLPMAAGMLFLLLKGPLAKTELARYVQHEVEWAEVVLFCVALGSLIAKMFHVLAEKYVFRFKLLPDSDGQVSSVQETEGLLTHLRKLPGHVRNTYLYRRVHAILDFLARRGSAEQLDDQLRSLTDNDYIEQESSLSLTRFITWAIPILGFLGTVLGITQAIAGVTPEVLEKDLSQVTDGLAVAFDSTALGLCLTMVVMFLLFVVERMEQGILAAVDAYVDEHLAHRFERVGGEGGEHLVLLRQQSNILVKAMEQLVVKQCELWSNTFAEMDRKAQGRLAGELQTALDKTHDAHARRLAQMEKQTVDQCGALIERMNVVASSVREAGKEQQSALAQIANNLNARTEALAKLQDGEKQMLRLHEVLKQNVSMLQAAGNWEQMVHSLTAAIHLLTAKTGSSDLRRAA